MTHQEAMQKQAQLLLQIGEIAMLLDQKQAEEAALRHQLLMARLELARLSGYAQALSESDKEEKSADK